MPFLRVNVDSIKEQNSFGFFFYLFDIDSKRRAKKLGKSLDQVFLLIGHYLFLNHGTAHLFKLSATYERIIHDLRKGEL